MGIRLDEENKYLFHDNSVPSTEVFIEEHLLGLIITEPRTNLGLPGTVKLVELRT